MILMLLDFASCVEEEKDKEMDCVDTNGIFSLINAFYVKVKKTVSLRIADPKPKVHYHLYTRLNPGQHQELLYNNSKYLDISNFNRSWPTRFIISGWLNVYNSCSSMIIKNAYLQKGNFNVITVSWDEKSQDIDYFYLSLTINRVAKRLADFTKYLNVTKSIPFSDMYLIGFSLGAQIAGLAGKEISPYKYKTIYALEPAGPMFHGLGFNGRVDGSDAEYVEAIQTNIGLAGYFGEAGKASFYPNYGTNQPHCLLRPICNHASAYEYFAESINANEQNEFIGTRCENFQKLVTFNICNCHFYGRNCTISRMGGEPAIPKTGVYFLRTNSKSPFGRRGEKKSNGDGNLKRKLNIEEEEEEVEEGVLENEEEDFSTIQSIVDVWYFIIVLQSFESLWKQALDNKMMLVSFANYAVFHARWFLINNQLIYYKRAFHFQYIEINGIILLISIFKTISIPIMSAKKSCTEYRANKNVQKYQVKQNTHSNINGINTCAIPVN
ncbi:phospholipase A1 VesT1.02-like [Condylostylus longicornis]|uniref:phospholipase A1 VesT1.02-like n=1 Tax=Condylostylus longicornis TaxID=2530218 RepID=UPI00244DBA57|nr:phospholipase A1 VesT1.02-like [Condylostylus longicornis]